MNIEWAIKLQSRLMRDAIIVMDEIERMIPQFPSLCCEVFFDVDLEPVLVVSKTPFEKPEDLKFVAGEFVNIFTDEIICPPLSVVIHPRRQFWIDVASQKFHSRFDDIAVDRITDIPHRCRFINDLFKF